MSYVQIVTKAAEVLNLLDESGRLIELDSLNVLDFVGELERVTKIVIPTPDMSIQHFNSIESVANLLAQLAAK